MRDKRREVRSPGGRRLPPRRKAVAGPLREARKSLGLLVDLVEADLLDEWEDLQADLLREWDEVEELVDDALRHARRVVLFVVGATLLLLGAALVFTPLPGTPVLLGGLSVLAVEFTWARRWRVRVERAAAEALEEVRERLGLSVP